MKTECFLCKKLLASEETILLQHFTPMQCAYCDTCYKRVKNVKSVYEMIELLREFGK